MQQRLVKSLGVGIIADLVNKLAPLLIIRIAQQRLGLEALGFAHFSLHLVDLFIPLVTWGYQNAASIFIAKETDHRRKAQLSSSLLVLKSIHLGVAFVCLFLVTTLVDQYAPYRDSALILSFLLLFSAINSSYLLISWQKTHWLNGIQSVSKVLSVVLVWLLVQDSDDALIYVGLYVFSNTAIALLTFGYGLKKLGFVKPTQTQLVLLWKHSLPFGFVALGVYSLLFTDFMIVEYFFSGETLGLFGGIQRVQMAVTSTVLVLSLVFFSESLTKSDRQSLTKVVHQSVWVKFAITLPIIAGSPFVGKELLSLVLGPAFAGGDQLLTALLLGVIPFAIFQIFGQQLLLVNKRFKTIMICFGLSTILALSFAALLVEPYGVEGIAVGAFLGKFIGMAFILKAGLKYIDSFPYRHLLASLIPTGVMVLALWSLPLQGLWAPLLVGIATYSAIFVPMNWSRLRNLRR